MVKKQKKHKGSIIIIAFLCILALAAIIFSYSYYVSSQIQILDLEQISFSVLPKNDENFHQINMKFSIETTSKTLKNSNKDTINEMILDILNNESYEKISGEGGTEYIKQKVTDKLNDNFNDGDLKGIYISEFTDKVSPFIGNDEKENGPNSDRNDVMKSLFPNMK